jgi:hypothetical protein
LPLHFLSRIQTRLEEFYGARTGTDVRDFVRASPQLPGLGHLVVEQTREGEDVNLALLLDRDILDAWEAHALCRDTEFGPGLSPTDVSVPLEEVSHFVYFSWNHGRGRNVTGLEMEIQSEVDRIVLAFHGQLDLPDGHRARLLKDLQGTAYGEERYETARRAAGAFIRQLRNGDPAAWTPTEFRRLREFFNSNLEHKLRLARH